MPNGKLARLLQAIGTVPPAAGGAPPRGRAREANGHVKQAPAQAAHSRKPGAAAGATGDGDGDAGAGAQARTRKRQRGGSRKPAPKLPSKRPRREAGPASKSVAAAAAAAAAGRRAAADEDPMQLEEERQKLLAGRSAYEALMDELARGRGGGGGGGKGGSRAAQQQQLQRLRREQRGGDESSSSSGSEEEGEEGEEEGGVGPAAGGGEGSGSGEEEEGEEEEGEEGEGEEEGEEEGGEAEVGERGRGGKGTAKAAAAVSRKRGVNGAAAVGTGIVNGEAGARGGGSGDDSDGGGGGASDAEAGAEGDVDASAQAGGQAGTAGRGRAAAVVDTWAVHVGRELSEAEVAALEGGKATKLSEDQRGEPGAAGGGGADFLSSIEIVVVDRADVMSMQNWAHVEAVFACLNRLPRSQHGTDIMRVRDWYLSGRAARYRQTVLLSSFAAPTANALMARGCANHGGSVVLRAEAPGVLRAVVPQEEETAAAAAAAAEQPTAAPPSTQPNGTAGGRRGAAAPAATPSTSAPTPSSAASPHGDFRSPQQRSLFSLLNSYADVHLPSRPYPTDPRVGASDSLMDAVLLHCLNHVAKTADRIKKNNHVLAAADANWAHVEAVFACLNRLPRSQHGTDIMRVRDWYLSGRAARYRQTVLLSSFAAPTANALMVRQLFERFAADSPAAAGDARFEFFTRVVWPRLKDSVTRGLLLFVPDYFDFLRLRNALRADDSVDFATITEYSSNSEVTRSRARFYHGQRRLLLYTERAHFYHRYRIRGIKDVLFYGLPEHAAFYPELLNLLEEGGGGGGGGGGGPGSHHATVTALFTRWDALALERVVGSARAARMLKGGSGTYMFSSSTGAAGTDQLDEDLGGAGPTSQRGGRDVLFYGLPEHAAFYPELLNLLEEGGGGGGGGGGGPGSHHATVTALFTRWDALALERVVGSARAARMLKGGSGTYMFC
ncbi:U3 small nucleolar RNA-associated protein 25 [Tetrabaena socialis]|uniref:U3 small nucleolar RNA-associated protein 25 n=1 Tax=Tetrabaena socialis TaxID=47790 RepID=A0A2J7ZQ96_9CHLO|nr:U3 small nucleolar RNA-associated protein 25 [Tetrabaena socialis]|eukprot:PNH02448.1 U3 small nucleolar RNA-associated protein 25 [Tetrabaena socialis]